MDTPSYTSLLARRMGYAGNWGDEFQSWLDAAPGRRDQYRNQWAGQPDGWDRALTPQEQQEAQTYGGTGATLTPTSPYDGGGVQPVGFVEPLNGWQKDALTQMADPITATRRTTPSTR